jgi:hypothetical protein
MRLQMMKFDKKKILRGLVIAFLGISAFWVGGFMWLTKGADWEAIELAIQNSSYMQAELKSNIVKVSPEFLGYGYGASENSGYANFKAEIQYAGGTARYRIHMMRSGQEWKVVGAEKLQ